MPRKDRPTPCQVEAVRAAWQDHYTNREIAERLGMSLASVARIQGGFVSTARRDGDDRWCDCGRPKTPEHAACNRCMWLDGEIRSTGGVCSRALASWVSELRALGGAATAEAIAEDLGIEPDAVMRNWYRFRGFQNRIKMIPGTPFELPIFVLSDEVPE